MWDDLASALVARTRGPQGRHEAQGDTCAARARRAPLTRTLLLHTGGSFWVDVTGIEGTRDPQLLHWAPGSPRIDPGLLSSALVSVPMLSDAWGRRLSHFVLDLAPHGPSPLGDSGQLAVALATLWYRHAARAGLPLVRAGEPSASGHPVVVLTGSGSLRPRRTRHGLFGYGVEPVWGWKDKLRHLDAAVTDIPLAEIHILCPRAQLAQVRSALLWTLHERVQPGRSPGHLVYRKEARAGASVWLHPVGTLGEVARMIDGLAAGLAGARAGGDAAPHGQAVARAPRARTAPGPRGQAEAASARRAADDAPARPASSPWRVPRLALTALLWLALGWMGAALARQCGHGPGGARGSEYGVRCSGIHDERAGPCRLLEHLARGHARVPVSACPPGNVHTWPCAAASSVMPWPTSFATMPPGRG